jgi:hypothetical protein
MSDEKKDKTVTVKKSIKDKKGKPGEIVPVEEIKKDQKVKKDKKATPKTDGADLWQDGMQVPDWLKDE